MTTTQIIANLDRTRGMLDRSLFFNAPDADIALAAAAHSAAIRIARLYALIDANWTFDPMDYHLARDADLNRIRNAERVGA